MFHKPNGPTWRQHMQLSGTAILSIGRRVVWHGQVYVAEGSQLVQFETQTTLSSRLPFIS
jgi:hypothetical protein